VAEKLKTHEFRVAISGLELDPELTRQINSAMQRVALEHLAAADFTNVAIHWPREWLGIWVEDLDSVIKRGELKPSEETHPQQA
jgi:hypothetical protein